MTWTVDETKILTDGEIAEVLADIKRRARHSINSGQNLIVFRLATCCGLRASEIAGLRVRHVHIGIRRPYLDLLKAITKGRKPRRIPLWLDQGTLDDLTLWRDFRIEQGSTPTGYFVCTQSATGQTVGNPLNRKRVRERFRTACRILGSERLRGLTVHHGRHTFVSHVVQTKGIAAAMQYAGHTSMAITGQYVHIVTDDNGKVGKMFEGDADSNPPDVSAYL